MSGKCKDCSHMEVCKLVDEHFDLNKRIQEMKQVLNTNFDIEIKCSKFCSNEKQCGNTLPTEYDYFMKRLTLKKIKY